MIRLQDALLPHSGAFELFVSGSPARSIPYLPDSDCIDNVSLPLLAMISMKWESHGDVSLDWSA